ncbi:uracil-DNA glycosylase [Sphingosinicella sp. BN140058]|uniref:uracil-DNA glycosylase n=1 Tax=Sphingosinicella sp. BN140058 TaxID=1892855 RepID=UPI001012FDA2|nr:uracil-DNA glycosylase [Sphingosinicella sp. BN140058]QAY80405.1 uracil-DNA glycosylase [Sphingosinicella sp. BN140058]
MTAPHQIPPFLREQVTRLDSSWRDALAVALEAATLADLGAYIADRQKAGFRVYPPRGDYLRALELTPLQDVRVVILGQDPYPQPGRAHGLSFSFATPGPPMHSLRNIFVELGRDLAVPFPSHANLESWARQGVLLLNTILTVEDGDPKSHAGRGWEPFTDAVIHAVANHGNRVVFMLWGNDAREKEAVIRAAAPDGRHCILATSHPSGTGAWRGFRGCGHFGQANAYLRQHGRTPIEWALPEARTPDLFASL